MSRPAVNILVWLAIAALSLILKAMGAIDDLAGTVYVMGSLCIISVWSAADWLNSESK